MTYQKKNLPRGERKGAHFFSTAKKNLLDSTRNIKKRQSSFFDTIHAAKFTTKLVAGALLMTVAVTVLVSLTKSQMSVSEKQRMLDDLDAQVAHQKLQNQELEERIAGDPYEYIEEYVRDKLDMVKPGERVYINTAGE